MPKYTKLFGVVLIGLLGLVGIAAVYTEKSPLQFGNFIALLPKVVTLPTVAGAESPYTISTPDKSLYTFDCQDSGGCGVYFSDTGAVEGQILVLTNRSSNTITVYDVSGKAELSGNASLGAADTLAVIYDNGAYNQLAPESDN